MRLQDSLFHAQYAAGIYQVHFSLLDFLGLLTCPWTAVSGVINDWTLASTSPLYARDKYLPYLDLFVCFAGSYWGIQGCKKQWKNTVAICNFWNKWMFSSSWLQAWLGARVPVIYYWSTATKSLCFHCFDKITLLDPDTGWFDLFFSLDKNAL